MLSHTYRPIKKKTHVRHTKQKTTAFLSDKRLKEYTERGWTERHTIRQTQRGRQTDIQTDRDRDRETGTERQT